MIIFLILLAIYLLGAVIFFFKCTPNLKSDEVLIDIITSISWPVWIIIASQKMK